MKIINSFNITVDRIGTKFSIGKCDGNSTIMVEGGGRGIGKTNCI